MKRMFKSFVLGAALLLIGSGGAWADGYASLRVVETGVLVNHGHGFAPVAGVVDLNIGDRVMAGEGALAILSYANCRITIKAGGVVTVVKKPPCLANSATDTNTVPPLFFGGFVHPGVIVGQFAGGFLASVEITDILISAPASN